MITCIRSTSDNNDFQELVTKLDRELAVLDGDDADFYAQFNKTAALRNVVVAYENDLLVGCGAFKPYSNEAVEVKRMYVDENQRGKGIATIVLNELEKWAAELNITTCVLETGKRQPDAIALYKKNGYRIIPNYGQYKDMENSVCFEKQIIK